MSIKSPYKEVGLNSKEISAGRRKTKPLPYLGWRPQKTMHRFSDRIPETAKSGKIDYSLAPCVYCGQPKFVVENQKCSVRKNKTKGK